MQMVRCGLSWAVVRARGLFSKLTCDGRFLTEKSFDNSCSGISLPYMAFLVTNNPS